MTRPDAAQPDDTEILMASLMDSIMFFDGAEDEVLDPDVCVQRLEEISVSLQSLSQRGRATFIELAGRRAEKATPPIEPRSSARCHTTAVCSTTRHDDAC